MSIDSNLEIRFVLAAFTWLVRSQFPNLGLNSVHGSKVPCPNHWTSREFFGNYF